MARSNFPGPRTVDSVSTGGIMIRPLQVGSKPVGSSPSAKSASAIGPEPENVSKPLSPYISHPAPYYKGPTTFTP